MAAKKDFTQVAFAIAQQATGVTPKNVPTAKQAASRKGGLKGGANRMAGLSDAERSELGAKAAKARWNKR